MTESQLIDRLAGIRLDIDKLFGRFLAIETKRPGQKPTAAQLRFLGMVQEAGGLALVAHDVTEVEAALKLEGIIP